MIRLRIEIIERLCVRGTEPTGSIGNEVSELLKKLLLQARRKEERYTRPQRPWVSPQQTSTRRWIFQPWLEIAVTPTTWQRHTTEFSFKYNLTILGERTNYEVIHCGACSTPYSQKVEDTVI